MKEKQNINILTDSKQKENGLFATIRKKYNEYQQDIQIIEQQKIDSANQIKECEKRVDNWFDSEQKAIESKRKAFDEEMVREQEQKEELSKQTQALFAEFNSISIAMADSSISSEQRKKMSEKQTNILQEISKNTLNLCIKHF